MKDQGLGALSNRSGFAYNFGDWKSKVKVSTSVFLPRPFSSVCRRPSSPHVCSWSSLCVCLCPDFLLEIRPIGSGPTPMISFCLNCLSKDPVSTQSHILGSWDWDVSTEVWERQNSVHNTVRTQGNTFQRGLGWIREKPSELLWLSQPLENQTPGLCSPELGEA